MISYQEKQLLATMKYLQNNSSILLNNLKKTTSSIKYCEEYEPNSLSLKPVKSYSELVQLAQNAGFDCYLRAKDILTTEEIADLEHRKQKIDKEFLTVTKLNLADYSFILVAIALQIIRQAIQPSLDFKNINPNNREGHYAAAQNTDKSKAIKKNDRAMTYASKQNIDMTFSRKYYAPLTDILDINKGVPYDITSIKGLGGGIFHRFKTLGHDPVLGYLFGTCNILTNTLTTNTMQTFFVNRTGRKVVTEIAETSKIFIHSKNRFYEDGGKFVVAAAIAKQTYHIHSDQKSKEGIGLPFLQLICDEKTIHSLCKQGIDYNLLEFIGSVTKQSAYSEFINFIIAISHRIYIAMENYKKYCNENHITNENVFEAIYQQNIKNCILYSINTNEVRTRKILLVSNMVASCANIIYVALGSLNANETLSKLDIGGIIVTIRHLFSDPLIISKIKDEFIKSTLNEDFQKRLSEIENFR